MQTQYVDDQNAYHYCELWKITGENVRIFSNPHSDGFADDSLHFQVRLSQGDLHADFFWSCGSGIAWDWAKKENSQIPGEYPGPHAAELVDCLISDADALDDGFDDWCANIGYDADSRKAKRTYETCRENANKLRDLIGPQCFETMRSEMERL